MESWCNPERSILQIKLLKTEYANQFITNGTVKFSAPESWVDYASTNSLGRGDFYEGTLAFCGTEDVTNYKMLQESYPADVNYTEIPSTKSRVLFKNIDDMKLPCFCLYTLNLSQFISFENTDDKQYIADIPSSFFRAFADYISLEDAEALPIDEQPAVIVIYQYEKFEQRLRDGLAKLGVLPEEIIVRPVLYQNFEKFGADGWMDFGTTPPNELFVKSDFFKAQHEVRVVVNTQNLDVLKRLRAPIDLGNMSDIAIMKTSYLYEGMRIQGGSSVEKWDL